MQWDYSHKFYLLYTEGRQEGREHTCQILDGNIEQICQ